MNKLTSWPVVKGRGRPLMWSNYCPEENKKKNQDGYSTSWPKLEQVISRRHIWNKTVSTKCLGAKAWAYICRPTLQKIAKGRENCVMKSMKIGTYFLWNTTCLRTACTKGGEIKSSLSNTAGNVKMRPLRRCIHRSKKYNSIIRILLIKQCECVDWFTKKRALVNMDKKIRVLYSQRTCGKPRCY